MCSTYSERYAQSLGNEATLLTAQRAADIISTVEFDQTGNYLATGDKGGRVVLFERNETVRVLRDYPAVSHLDALHYWSIPNNRLRKRLASTNSIPSSSHTNPSLTT